MISLKSIDSADDSLFLIKKYINICQRLTAFCQGQHLMTSRDIINLSTFIIILYKSSSALDALLNQVMLTVNLLPSDIYINRQRKQSARFSDD